MTDDEPDLYELPADEQQAEYNDNLERTPMDNAVERTQATTVAAAIKTVCEQVAIRHLIAATEEAEEFTVALWAALGEVATPEDIAMSKLAAMEKLASLGSTEAQDIKADHG